MAVRIAHTEPKETFEPNAELLNSFAVTSQALTSMSSGHIGESTSATNLTWTRPNLAPSLGALGFLLDFINAFQTVPLIYIPVCTDGMR